MDSRSDWRDLHSANSKGNKERRWWLRWLKCANIVVLLMSSPSNWTDLPSLLRAAFCHVSGRTMAAKVRYQWNFKQKSLPKQRKNRVDTSVLCQFPIITESRSVNSPFYIWPCKGSENIYDLRTDTYIYILKLTWTIPGISVQVFCFYGSHHAKKLKISNGDMMWYFSTRRYFVAF